MGFCKFTKSGQSPRADRVVRPYEGRSGTPSPTTAHRTRPQGAMPTAPRRANAHFAAGHTGPALQGTPGMQDGTSRTPSPTTVHRTRPQGTMPTAPRRTNAHFAAGHMGPALQGTPVMQDGTSGRRPLQRLTVPVRRRRCPHIARRQHKEAGASACLSVVRLFTWRSWRPHDRRGRPSDSAP